MEDALHCPSTPDKAIQPLPNCLTNQSLPHTLHHFFVSTYLQADFPQNQGNHCKIYKHLFADT